MKTANLVISCPDQKGIVYEVTSFLFAHRANISSLEQHIEDGMFFMRVEWEIEHFDLPTQELFEKEFQEIQTRFSMDIRSDFHIKQKSIGLFCSKEGHCLIDILGRVAIKELNIKIPYVISNFEELREITEKFNIPFYYIPAKKDSFDHEKMCLEIVRQYPTDLIGLARYMKVLSPEFIQSVGQKIINVHHSFLPSFIGASPYKDAYERGVKLIGATAHYVTAELDQGPIIEQRIKRISHNHNIENLKLMGRESEKESFAFALKKHIENKVIVYKNRVIIFE